MKTITLEIPDNLDEQDAKTMLAARLYEKGDLSIGQAAQLAGYTKGAFMEILGNYNISLFNYTEATLDQELLDAKNYHR